MSSEAENRRAALAALEQVSRDPYMRGLVLAGLALRYRARAPLAEDVKPYRPLRRTRITTA